MVRLGGFLGGALLLLACGGTSTAGNGSGTVSAGGASAGAGASGGDAMATGGTVVTDACNTSSDCRLNDDCCTCAPAAISRRAAFCGAGCDQSACARVGLEHGVACVGKRCVFNVSCDSKQALCRVAPPDCPTGQVATVINGCYGPCIAVEQCADTGR